MITVEAAQRDVRSTFLGGFPGQLVSSVLWLVSAALGTWGTRRSAILFLVIGGAFIFPLAQLLLRALGRKAALEPGNPMGQLARQVAFTVPLGLPLVAAATLYRPNWFYPAFMLVVGTHYLPFMFLYGMRLFGVLAALLVAGGLLTGLYASSTFALGGWITGAVLFVFAFIGRTLAAETRHASDAAPENR